MSHKGVELGMEFGWHWCVIRWKQNSLKTEVGDARLVRRDGVFPIGNVLHTNNTFCRNFTQLHSNRIIQKSFVAGDMQDKSIDSIASHHLATVRRETMI